MLSALVHEETKGRRKQGKGGDVAYSRKARVAKERNRLVRGDGPSKVGDPSKEWRHRKDGKEIQGQ